ncbi:MAG: FMN-binding protein [Epsilonproteobacteria bacterium]|nr:FMN-binding protein [Campylobacterota bacterium]
MKSLILSLFLACEIFAVVLLSPLDAMQSSFAKGATISKESIVLTKEQASKIESLAKSKLESKIVRIFFAKQEEKIIGYGILLSQKVRSKNAVALYMIKPDGVIEAVEIVAFNEPLEYMPSSTWNKEFAGKSGADELRSGKDIPTITGATLSARSITDAARIALAIHNTLYGSN